MFVVEYKLVNGMSARFDFQTSTERDIFMKGVESAINWPRRTHKGVTTSEVQNKPVVQAAPPLVKPAVVEEGKVAPKAPENKE